ncbi:hypothetical protein MIMGU_mgv1a0246702mg, partial [Erythranthe guttata]
MCVVRHSEWSPRGSCPVVGSSSEITKVKMMMMLKLDHLRELNYDELEEHSGSLTHELDDLEIPTIIEH